MRRRPGVGADLDAEPRRRRVLLDDDRPVADLVDADVEAEVAHVGREAAGEDRVPLCPGPLFA